MKEAIRVLTDTQQRRVLVKLRGQSPGLVTLVMDRLANIPTTIERMLDDHGVEWERQGYKVLSEDYGFSA